MSLYHRDCPECGVIKSYSSKLSYQNALRKNTVCRKCAAVAGGFLNRDINGVNNPFYGKKHSEESKIKMSIGHKGACVSGARRKELSLLMSGEGNPMWQRSLFDVWESKYGKEHAQVLKTQWIQRMSASMSGEQNPMFGKQTPTGAGNGWSGWYKDWYFRSLGELSYVVNVLEPTNQHWVSAESTGIKILYIHWNGSKRTYIPDFLVNHDSLIECKPQKLHDSPLVQIKRQAAEQYCKNHGLTYQVVAPPKINTQWLIDAVDSELVKLLKPYELKLEDYRQS